MTAVLAFFDAPHDELVAAFRSTDLETAAFGFAGRLRGGRRTGLIVRAVEVVPDSGYRARTPGHFTLEPAFVAEMALRAQAEGSSLVVFHSHPGRAYPPDFSSIDDEMHRGLVPSFLRLIEGPVGSAVWSPAGWNARLWEHAGNEQRVELVKTVGAHLRLSAPGADRRTDLEMEAWGRQMRAFGRPVQEQLRRLRVGVVGLGGTGSLAAQGLGHLGVGNFLLVDPDHVETTNLSRIVGSTPADADSGLAKVEVAARVLRSISPDACIELAQEDVTHCATLRRLGDCDVIMSCTDSHASRAAVNQLPFQYGVPVIDVGSLIRTGARGSPQAFTEVRLVTPGAGCLRCQGVINYDRVFSERLTPSARRELAALGYSPDLPMQEPSVLPLNSLGVSFALLQLLDLLEPWLEWNGRLAFDVRAGTTVHREREPRPDCDVCSDAGVWGRADDQALLCVPSPLSG